MSDADWLAAHLRSMVAARPSFWAGSDVTLLQLSALHFISAHAPVTLTVLAESLGTGAPATSAMVDRLIRAGLVSRTRDRQDRRRILWAAQDLLESRPALSRWHPDWKDAFERFMTGRS